MCTPWPYLPTILSDTQPTHSKPISRTVNNEPCIEGYDYVTTRLTWPPPSPSSPLSSIIGRLLSKSRFVMLYASPLVLRRLTVINADPAKGWFDFMLVGYTQGHITLPKKAVGDRVNLEVDVPTRGLATGRHTPNQETITTRQTKKKRGPDVGGDTPVKKGKYVGGDTHEVPPKKRMCRPSVLSGRLRPPTTKPRNPNPNTQVTALYVKRSARTADRAVGLKLSEDQNFGDTITQVTAKYVERSVGALAQRVADLEARLAALESRR